MSNTSIGRVGRPAPGASNGGRSRSADPPRPPSALATGDGVAAETAQEQQQRRRPASGAGDEVYRSEVIQLYAALESARAELRRKEEEVAELTATQTKVDDDIHELTEKLFQEAYKMVATADGERRSAERRAAESQCRADMLHEQVAALKHMVAAMRDERHGQAEAPQRAAAGHSTPTKARLGFLTPERRRGAAPAAAAALDSQRAASTGSSCSSPGQVQPVENLVDPLVHGEFVQWRQSGHPLRLDGDCALVRRLLGEDFAPAVLAFDNGTLARRALDAIWHKRLEVELVAAVEAGTSGTPARVMRCALTGVPRICNYRMRLLPAEGNATDEPAVAGAGADMEHSGTEPTPLQQDDAETASVSTSAAAAECEWHHISAMARHRLVAAAELYALLDYLRSGIVQCGLHEAYWRLVRCRRSLAHARFGFPPEKL